jgi:sulfoxide reductase heme-binding subunit YedZ
MTSDAAVRRTVRPAKPAGRPWRDPAGRFSAFKTAVFAGLFIPAAILAGRIWAVDLGPRPLTELIHETGHWAVYFLLLTLAITPFRRLFRWPQLLWVRRMLGLAAAAYALAHFGLYIVDSAFDIGFVASEIVKRLYLTIGFVALVGLVPLAATSTNAMMKRLGGVRWKRLQSLIYLIVILAIIHFFMQSKADIRLPTIAAGLLAWLFVWRIANRLPRLAESWPLWATFALALFITAGAALTEAIYYNLARNVPIGRVLEANLSAAPMIRPAVIVLGVGLAVTAFSAWRRWVKDRVRKAA